ncbi:MAG: hypothetical protein QOI99_627, partial [Actinomycetota bacterium]|nr:hypothetical protein [Actinomycetota bacterium]
MAVLDTWRPRADSSRAPEHGSPGDQYPG